MLMKSLPSKEKIKYLRKAGVINWSSSATRLMITGGVFIALWFSKETIEEFLLNDFTAAIGTNGSFSTTAIRDLIYGILRVFIITAGAALIFGILGSIAQTRGAIGTAILRRLRRRKFRVDTFTTLVWLVVCGVCGFICTDRQIPEIMSVIQMDNSESIKHASGVFLGRICKLVVVASLALAILVMFVSRVAFLLRNREGRDQA